tara:strand:+ start:1079 stop:1420 length:342 start_codon:yes stop_codon:yes gene_type:complete
MMKFLYFGDSTADALCVPANRLEHFDVSSGTQVQVRLECQQKFNVSVGATQQKTFNLATTDNKGKEVIESIVSEIRSGKKPMIIVADDADSTYLTSDISAVSEVDGSDFCEMG